MGLKMPKLFTSIAKSAKKTVATVKNVAQKATSEVKKGVNTPIGKTLIGGALAVTGVGAAITAVKTIKSVVDSKKKQKSEDNADAGAEDTGAEGGDVADEAGADTEEKTTTTLAKAQEWFKDPKNIGLAILVGFIIIVIIAGIIWH